MKNSRWLRSAISDDTIVANLLLTLKHSSPSPSPSPLTDPLLPTWGLRQPRSKPPTSSFSISAPPPPENKTNPRRSPTTPLSWTASPSDGGCEEATSSQPQPSHRFPSKISAASDTPTTSLKRPRRKKTFAELKEEESSLLNERLHLQKELETVHMTLKEQRSINENLKRIKLDLHVQSGIKSESNSDLVKTDTCLFGTYLASSSSVSRLVKNEDASEHSCLTQKGASSKELVFVLPDLNMAPDEECDLISGMS